MSFIMCFTPKNPETGNFVCRCCGWENDDIEFFSTGGFCWDCSGDFREPCQHGKDYDECSPEDEAGNPDPFFTPAGAEIA